jgi:diguanylate cyclase (GGDEF)-like protein/PAS domain S-box-containing protein
MILLRRPASAAAWLVTWGRRVYRVYGCIIDQHDIRLVLLAAIICAITAGTTFGIYSRVAHARGALRTMWLLVTGVCAASGIWATHFVAMLAYEDNLPTSFDPGLTGGSLVIAIIATTAGFAVCARGGLRHAAVGGAIIGLGISLMHFTGMRALIIGGTLEWDWAYVAVAVALGIGLGAASTVAYEKLSAGRPAIVAGAVLLTLAICAMHFTAMAAAIIMPDPTVMVSTGFSADATMLALAVAGLVGLVIFAGIIVAVIDHRTHQVNVDQVRELVDAASEGILICHDGVIINANRRIAEMCGRPVSELVGKHAAVDLLQGLQFDELAAASETEAAIRGADGKLTPVEVIRRPFRSGVRSNEVYAIRDLSERYRSEAKIAHMARHDPVTDLPNRVLLRERLEPALTTRRRDEHVAVLCLDLSRFKSINDAFGRPVGDALLRKVARRLLGCVRASDTVARIGADEFVIIQCSPDPWRQAADLAERVIEVVGMSCVLKGHDVRVATSVGIAVPTSEDVSADELIGQAEMALHAAKAIGRGSYVFFEPEMNARAHERHEMERDLRQALRRGELEMFYQPFVDLERMEVCGAEALMRWRHPERGLITPDRFIPIAEETGLIIEMGAWALREACAEAAGWPSGIKLAVNLSPVQFTSPRLVETVCEALDNSGLTVGRLELEVTESVLLQDSQPTLAALRRLHDLGIGISMDDFGTGYSSLSYLQKFAFDKIKIDRCFLSSAQPKEAQAVIRAICGLGDALQLAVTAEGVETAEQLELVRSEGCIAAQGYYFSPPVSAEALRAMLPASAKAHAA